MPSAARKGDIGSAHGCFPPSPSIEGSDDVIINSKPAVRLGDAYAAHGCGNCPPHGRKASQGSATVNINGKPAVRIGDNIDCGGTAQTGSPNVFIGDETWTGLPFEPIKPLLRLYLVQTPGKVTRPYRNEPYKLYKDGGLTQEGVTNDEGCIEYEYDPPWMSELKVKSRFGEYIYLPQSPPPAEVKVGIKQRLNALGYYNDDGKEESVDTDGKPQYDYFMGDQGEDLFKILQTSLTKKVKPLIP